MVAGFGRRDLRCPSAHHPTNVMLGHQPPFIQPTSDQRPSNVRPTFDQRSTNVRPTFDQRSTNVRPTSTVRPADVRTTSEQRSTSVRLTSNVRPINFRRPPDHHPTNSRPTSDHHRSLFAACLRDIGRSGFDRDDSRGQASPELSAAIKNANAHSPISYLRIVGCIFTG